MAENATLVMADFAQYSVPPTADAILLKSAAGVKLFAVGPTGDVTMSLKDLVLDDLTVGGTLTVTGATALGSTLTVTSASASALAVGRLGATTPALQVDASTATSITGLKVKSAAAGGGVALSAIGETNVAVAIDAAGSGTVTINGTGTGAITLARATTASVSIATPALDGVAPTVGGLVIGAANTSKLGFYGHAVIAQQTGVAVDAAAIHAALVALGLFTA